MCGKEFLDRGGQEVGLVFRDEGATAGDQLESALRQQWCQPSSMVTGEDGHKTVGAALRYRHSQSCQLLGYIESRAQATPKTATRDTRVSGTPKRKKVPDEYPPGFITIRFV